MSGSQQLRPIGHVAAEVSFVMGVSVGDMLSVSLATAAITARHATYLAASLVGHSTGAIASFFGRDASTVRWALRKAEGKDRLVEIAARVADTPWAPPPAPAVEVAPTPSPWTISSDGPAIRGDGGAEYRDAEMRSRALLRAQLKTGQHHLRPNQAVAMCRAVGIARLDA